MSIIPHILTLVATDLSQRDRLSLEELLKKMHDEPDKTSDLLGGYTRTANEHLQPVLAAIAIMIADFARMTHGEDGDPDPLATPVRELNLAKRTKNILTNNKIFVVHDLKRFDEASFLALKNVGPAMLAEVNEVLKRFGGRIPKAPK